MECLWIQRETSWDCIQKIEGTLAASGCLERKINYCGFVGGPSHVPCTQHPQRQSWDYIQKIEMIPKGKASLNQYHLNARSPAVNVTSPIVHKMRTGRSTSISPAPSI